MRNSLLLLAAFELGGCAPATVRGTGYCAPPRSAQTFASDPPPQQGATREEQLAALLGLHEVLRQGVHDQSTRITVLERVEDAHLTIAATSAELDCEATRSRQAADFLASKQSSTVQTLTVGSIAAGAATGIVGVFLSTSNTSNWTQNGFAIGGGAATAGLGLASLFVQSDIRFEHPRNLLSDLWSGPNDSSKYPPLVWGYLTQPDLSNDREGSIRDKLVARWRHLEGVDDDVAPLLFGSGGLYHADTLRLRARMCEAVSAEVELENQEIATLAARLRR